MAEPRELPTHRLGYAIEYENRISLQTNGMEPALLLKAAASFPPFNTDTNPMSIVTLLNQKNQGACQGHSLATIFQICYFLMTGRIVNFSRAAAYYLSQAYDGIRGDNGSTLSAGQKVATQHGLCLESEWKYPNEYDPREPNPKPNYAFKLVAAKATKDSGIIREALDMGLPVQDGIKWNDEVSRTLCDRYTGGGPGGGHSTTLWLKRNNNYIRINSWGFWDGDGCNENTPTALDQQIRYGSNSHVIYAPEGMIYPKHHPFKSHKPNPFLSIGKNMKLADVKIGWSASVSTDVEKNILSVSIDGNEPTVSELSPEVESVIIEVKASSSVIFSVTTVDKEGLSTVSETYTFTIGDLEAPQPVTGLFHEIVAVREA